MEVTLQEFNEVIAALEKGELRVARKVDGEWVVNRHVKEVILAGFKLGAITDMSEGQFPFFDKNTFPVRQFNASDGVRIVPGGTSIRRGAYLAPGSIVMPPAYVNVGAYVGEGTMVDSHVTIGSTSIYRPLRRLAACWNPPAPCPPSSRMARSWAVTAASMKALLSRKAP